MLLAIALLGNADAAKADKVDVCHNDDTGYHIINISENAVDKHVDNHGDWEVTDEVCGDGLDNDCDGEVDEDCCPCGDYWPDVSEVNVDACYQDYSPGYAYEDLSYVFSDGDFYGVFYFVNWNDGYTSDDSTCLVIDYNSGDVVNMSITDEEHVECAAEVDAIIDAAGATGTCY